MPDIMHKMHANFVKNSGPDINHKELASIIPGHIHVVFGKGQLCRRFSAGRLCLRFYQAVIETRSCAIKYQGST